MLRHLIPILLLATPAMGANELRALVEASSVGNYAVIRNPDNPGQAWDVNPGGWATYNRTDGDQQIALGSAVAAGVSDEWQYGNLPAGLTATASYGFDVYDEGDELIGTGVTEQMATQAAQERVLLALAAAAPGGTGGLPLLDSNLLVGGNVVRIAGTSASYPVGGLASQTDLTIIGNQLDNVESSVNDVLDDTADMQPKLGTPTGSLALMLSGIDVDISNLDAAATVDAVNVNKRRTWRVNADDEAPEAGNVVTVRRTQKGTLRFDFEDLINDGTVIVNVTSVTLTEQGDADPLVADNLRLTPDKKSALFDVEEFTSVGTYEVIGVVVTVDSQEIPMKGTLKVE